VLACWSASHDGRAAAVRPLFRFGKGFGRQSQGDSPGNLNDPCQAEYLLSGINTWEPWKASSQNIPTEKTLLDVVYYAHLSRLACTVYTDYSEWIGQDSVISDGRRAALINRPHQKNCFQELSYGTPDFAVSAF
jgi:hypothetical protein